MQRLFVALDRDRSGDISLSEFSNAVQERREGTTVRTLFDAMDQDSSGKVHYSEFLAAAQFSEPEKSFEFDVNTDEIFTRLDRDSTGTINMLNLKAILGPNCSEKHLRTILGGGGGGDDDDAESGATKRGTIDLQQFRTLMGLVKKQCRAASCAMSPPGSPADGPTEVDSSIIDTELNLGLPSELSTSAISGEVGVVETTA